MFGHAEKDYNLKITVRNARILRRMAAKGMNTYADLARRAGIRYEKAMRVCDLKTRLVLVDGEFASGVMEVCEALGAMPSDLWSPEMLARPMRKTTSSVDVSTDELATITQQDNDPETLMIADERLSKAREVLNSLPKRTAEIMALRYGLNGPPQEHAVIGRQFGISPPRVQQIIEKGEHQAKRQARRPKQAEIRRRYQ